MQISPYWIFGCFSIMGVIFVGFIYFIVLMIKYVDAPPTATNSDAELLMMKYDGSGGRTNG